MGILHRATEARGSAVDIDIEPAISLRLSYGIFDQEIYSLVAYCLVVTDQESATTYPTHPKSQPSLTDASTTVFSFARTEGH